MAMREAPIHSRSRNRSGRHAAQALSSEGRGIGGPAEYLLAFECLPPSVPARGPACMPGCPVTRMGVGVGAWAGVRVVQRGTGARDGGRVRGGKVLGVWI